jgi:hypothetical protein
MGDRWHKKCGVMLVNIWNRTYKRSVAEEPFEPLQVGMHPIYLARAVVAAVRGEADGLRVCLVKLLNLFLLL